MIYIFVCVLYHNDLDKEKSKHIETQHMLDLLTNLLRITIEERKKCEKCREEYCY